MIEEIESPRGVNIVRNDMKYGIKLKDLRRMEFFRTAEGKVYQALTVNGDHVGAYDWGSKRHITLSNAKDVYLLCHVDILIR